MKLLTMMKRLPLLLLMIATFCLSGFNPTSALTISPTTTTSSKPITFPKIDRHPLPDDWDRGEMTSVPKYDPNPDDDSSLELDLCAYDLSTLDLSNSLYDLLYASFDDRTIWPPDDRMPQGFDRQGIMELGAAPGLGVRDLHALGITGRDVGIAIIDRTLLVDHQEYASRLRLYEETDEIDDSWPSEMHGPAVASIAVGQTVGVAPGADLYYIATNFGIWEGNEEEDLTYVANSIRRILEINQQLPEGRKIRVISISKGWGPDVKGYDEVNSAAEEAKATGMLVICSNTEEVHGFKFDGLGRAPLSDPGAAESYEPPLWWAEDFYGGERFSDSLLVPMDSRTTASPSGDDEYVFYREGGWSWSIPYIAGVYALAVQVDPAITPEQFWSLAMQTGRTIELDHNDEIIPFGPIIDPITLIDALKSK